MVTNEKKTIWTFRSPEIYYGIGAIDALDTIPFNHCFIVTDEGIIRFGLIKIIEKKFNDLKRKYTIFSEVEPDPTEEIVMKAVKKCNECSADLILALGGGSAIDTAKAVLALCELPGLDLEEIAPFSDISFGNKIKLVAIPTTSGTGADVTWASVITKKDEVLGDLKLELAHKDMIPHIAIIDPVFTKTLPPAPTAATGLDAVTHIIEGIVSIFTNEFSYGLGLAAMENLRTYLPIAYKNGSDMLAREKIHTAATMAGLCFGNAQITLGHSLGHSLGTAFHVAHGLSVGVFLPYVLEFYINNTDKKAQQILAKFARQLGIAQWAESDEKAAKMLIQDLKDLMKKVDFPSTLTELNLTKEKIEKNMDVLVQKTFKSVSLLLSPRIPNEEQVKKIILYTLEGKSVDF